MLQFNTGKKLEKAFPPEQFDALIDFFEEHNGMFATTGDNSVREDLKALELRLNASLRESELRTQLEIEKVRGEVKETEAKLKTEIEKIRAEVKETEARLKIEIEKVRGEVKETEARVIEKLESNKHELLKWITGMVVAQAAVFVALAGVAVGLVAFYPK